MNVNSLEQMHFLIENYICPSVPITFCGSNELLDSNFSSGKICIILCALEHVCQFDAFWLLTEIVKLLCSPSVVPYTVEVW